MSKRILLFSILFILLFGFSKIAFAQLGYEPLTEIPGLTDQNTLGKNVDLGEFLTNAYNFLVAIGVGLAVIMITIGGFGWLTSAASDDKSKAKKRIKDSISGLLLILLTYIILYTINPDTTRLNFLLGVEKVVLPEGENIRTPRGYYYMYQDNQLGHIRPGGGHESIEACQKAAEDREKISYSVFDVSECTDRKINLDDRLYTFTQKSSNQPESAVANLQFRPINDRTTEKKYFTNKNDCDNAYNELTTTQVKPYKVVVECFAKSPSGYEFETLADKKRFEEVTYTYNNESDYEANNTSFFSLVFSFDPANGSKKLYRSRPYFGISRCYDLQRELNDRVFTTYHEVSSCEPETYYESSYTNPVVWTAQITRNGDEGEKAYIESQAFTTKDLCEAFAKEQREKTKQKYSIIQTCQKGSDL